MLRLTQAVVVEGRYDKIKLASLLDATIIETNGFSIFHDQEKMTLLRELAKRTGLIVLTDSDAAGFQIRAYIKSCVRCGCVLHAYIPEILGKEKRKQRPSAQGTLGVEGMPADILTRALLRAGATVDTAPDGLRRRITKADFYEDGLSGGQNSHALRTALLTQLELPRYLSTNSMLDVFNTILSVDAYRALVQRCKSMSKNLAEAVADDSAETGVQDGGAI